MTESEFEFPRYDLAGRKAVVTGASQGIGSWIALGLAEAGADVAVNYYRSCRQAEEVCGRIADLGHKAVPLAADVRDPEAAAGLIATAETELGGLDILVNNAGVNVHKKALDMTPADFDHIVHVNTRGVYFCAQAAARVMIPRKYGKIINIASAAAFLVRQGIPNSVYAMTKAGVVMLTKALAEEWSGHNINVNAVAPGYFLTSLTADRISDPKVFDNIVKSTPLHRIGAPKDIIAAVTFLASDAAGFITGQTLPVDGGRTIL